MLISATTLAFTHGDEEKVTDLNCDVRRGGKGLRNSFAWFDGSSQEDHYGSCRKQHSLAPQVCSEGPAFQTQQFNTAEEKTTSDPRRPVKDGAVESAHFQIPASICSPSAVLSSFKTCTLSISEWKNTVGHIKMQLSDKWHSNIKNVTYFCVDLVIFLTLN